MSGPSILRASAWVLLAQGAALAAFVMPRVAADPFTAATPNAALPAFGALVAFLVLAGTVLWALDGRGAGPGGRWRGALVLLLAMVALAAIALADAAGAYLGHGPAMRGVALLLIACTAVDAAVAVALARLLWLGRRRDPTRPRPGT